jgi:hypothetical protein
MTFKEEVEMSPRPTPTEMREAKLRKTQERDELLRQHRIERMDHLKLRIRWEHVSSELDGIYFELDKIYKKAPEEQISALTVDIVNQVISDAKEVIDNDPYIDRVKQFVPAGDNPEYRDVIMVLKQVRQGLDRFKKSYMPGHKSLSELVEELESLKAEEE